MRMALGRYEEAVRRRAGALAPGVERIWQPRRDVLGRRRGPPEVRRESAWLAGHRRVDAARRARIQEFADEVRAAGFRDAVVLGMGGSSLAPEVLRRSIADGVRGRDDHPRLHVLDTTDPATIAAWRTHRPCATLFFVSSKSGTTIEANVLFEYFHDLVRQREGRRRAAKISWPSPMPARRWRSSGVSTGSDACSSNPSDIGGRYSALSYFGLVPAAVAGLDIDAAARARSRRGARGQEAGQRRGAARRGARRTGAGRTRQVHVRSSSPAIASFGLWAEQLIAESTGKEGTGIVPIDREPLGAAEAVRRRPLLRVPAAGSRQQRPHGCDRGRARGRRLSGHHARA